MGSNPYKYGDIYIYILVGGFNPSEKWWSSSVGMMTFPLYGKNVPNHHVYIWYILYCLYYGWIYIYIILCDDICMIHTLNEIEIPCEARVSRKVFTKHGGRNQQLCYLLTFESTNDQMSCKIPETHYDLSSTKVWQFPPVDFMYKGSPKREANQITMRIGRDEILTFLGTPL